MRTLLALPYLNIYLHEAAWPMLELEWLSYATSADMRAAVLQALRLTHTYHPKSWLTDDRRQGAIRPRDLEWAEQAVLLPLNESGIERFAQLESSNDLHRLTVEAMYARVQPQLRFELRRFADLEEARTWATGG